MVECGGQGVPAPDRPAGPRHTPIPATRPASCRWSSTITRTATRVLMSRRTWTLLREADAPPWPREPCAVGCTARARQDEVPARSAGYQAAKAKEHCATQLQAKVAAELGGRVRRGLREEWVWRSSSSSSATRAPLITDALRRAPEDISPRRCWTRCPASQDAPGAVRGNDRTAADPATRSRRRRRRRRRQLHPRTFRDTHRSARWPSCWVSVEE